MLLGKIFHRTTIYKFYDFIRSGIRYNKTKNSVGKLFYSDELKLLMQQYLKTNLKEDWIGRLYGVVNPTINNGQLDISTMVIELDGNHTNNDDWATTWIYKQLRLVGQLFKINGLYDYINLEIKKVGPINLDNYLVIFDLVDRKIYTNSAKTFFKSILFWGSITGIVFILNSFLHFF